MKAIHTRYFGPTDFKGSRIKASDGDHNSITISYASESSNPHRDAAVALCNKLGWHGTLCEGSDARGNVYVFVYEQDTFKV